MKKINFLIILLLIITLSSCDKGKNEKNINQQAVQNKPVEKQKPGFTFQSSNIDSANVSLADKKIVDQDWDKKIIKTANVKLEVADYKKYNESIHNTIRQFGAYIAQEEQVLSEEMSENILAIKVPVAQFEPMMNQLTGTDIKVLERKITTEDVSGEVIDTKSRLEAKKQVRLKYLDFLKQSKNMEEVLQVQNEINGIQEEIEAAAGRIGYLSQQASYSTINLTYYQPMEAFKPNEKAPGFIKRVSLAFRTGLNWIADIFVSLMSLWPFILILTVVLFIWKKIKKATPVH